MGIRLDKALSTHPEIESRSQATNLIDKGFVRFENRIVKPSRKTNLSESFSVHIETPEASPLTPYDYNLDIVHEDSDVIVVNKASGLVVHPAAGHYNDTLVNALLHRTNELAEGSGAERPGVVHRIDKDTSGLIVIAKNNSALRVLARQFKNKSVHRVYWAVAYGRFQHSSGSVTSYIRRHPRDRKKFTSEPQSGAPQGKLAITHYEIKKAHPAGLSLIHCRLETGRTHQIRVHLSQLGHPIVADPIYCTSHRVKSVKSSLLRGVVECTPHLMLHAAELGFIHPRTKKKMAFQVSWPEELHSTLRALDFL